MSQSAKESPQRLRIDLRGKTMEEVVAALKEGGYCNIRYERTDAYEHDSIFGPALPGVVYCIAIEDSEAPNLTVVPTSGREHCLRPGHDLYFHEGEKGGWGWARTSYLYK